MADSALRLPPCPQRLPLLFPKISLRCDFREPYFTACGISADADHLHGRLFCRWRCSTDLNRPRAARAVRARERPSAATLCRGSRRETAIQQSIRSPADSSRQGAMADSALRLPPCPQRLPLLFPKISLRCDFREPCFTPPSTAKRHGRQCTKRRLP